MIKSSSFQRQFAAVIAGVLGLAALSWTTPASAQVVYNENFNSGYNSAQSLSDQAGWTTNDEFTGATYNGADVGQSDGVSQVGGVALANGDLQGILGGVYYPGTAVPGTNAVTLGHGFALGSGLTASINLDYVVTQSQTPNSNHDAFGIALRNTAGGTLFSVDFTRLVNTNDPKYTTYDNIGYTSGSSTPVTALSFQLGLRYHLTITLNGRGTANQTFSASFFTEDSTTGLQNGGVFNVATNVAYTGTVAGLAATWNLFSNSTAAANGTATGFGSQGTNNTAYNAPGSNALYFDNIVVAVPEPSTYALLGVGAFGLMVLRRRLCA